MDGYYLDKEKRGVSGARDRGKSYYEFDRTNKNFFDQTLPSRN